MKATEIRYRMGVAGSFAGLVAWATGVSIPVLLTLPAEAGWMAELMDSGLVGLWIGGFGAGIAARIARHGAGVSSGLRALGGALAGLAAGAGGVGLSLGVRAIWRPESASTGILLAWILTGSSVGFVLGLLRHGSQWRNVLLALAGGAVGAAAGAAVLIQWGAAVEYVTRASGLMLTGAAICLCSELAVRLRRKAVLCFVSSADPDVETQLRGQEWELLSRSRLLLGRKGPSPAGVLFVQVPDPAAGPRHAWIRGTKEGFELLAHEANIGPSGSAVWALEAGSPPASLRGTHLLRDGDEIVVGRSRFSFRLRARAARPVVSRRLLVSLALHLGLAASLAPAAAQHLSLAERPRLLRAAEGSETPVFSVQLNRLDREGRPLPIPILTPGQAIKEVRVTEDGRELRVCHVSLGALPERRAILLVDVSGSMLERVSGGRTKFDVMKDACLRFATSFEDGIDRVAVIPFDSHGVVTGVRRAKLFTRAGELRAAIESLPVPTAGNTGLYTAVIETLARIRNDLAAPSDGTVQYLLVVLTDGKNDVHPGDDPGLETDLEPVVRSAEETGIQIITVGFGTAENLNETELRRMAWPSERNYLPAEWSEDVVTAFERARMFQVERLTVSFRPQQKLISQLVSSRRFTVSFAGDQTTFPWIPRPVNVAEGVAESCEPDDAPHWPRFVLVLACGLGLHLYLWRKVPRRLWGAWNDARVLRARAEGLWKR
jgi:Mg-chelatase subunit ChlD